MDNKYLVLLIGLILIQGIIINPIFASGFTEKGNIGLKVEKTSYLDWLFKSTIYAFVQPNIEVMPGDTVQMDSLEYMNCGLCDLSAYPTRINGYTIKVYNSNGNMVEEQQFYNWEIRPGVDYIKCGESANFVYYYNVPDNAVPGTWRIELEVAVSPIYSILPSCIVAQDEGSFTVGTSCENKEREVQKCIDENTLYYKPANSCNIQYTQCDQIISGGKCQNDRCQAVEKCGDGICDEYENYLSCYEDCGFCGDKVCQIKYEDSTNCPEDCNPCGDGVCSEGESLICGLDCADCGDGECYWYEKKGEDFACKEDCFPDNGLPDLDTMVIIAVIIFMIGIMGILILKKPKNNTRR